SLQTSLGSSERACATSLRRRSAPLKRTLALLETSAESGGLPPVPPPPELPAPEEGSPAHPAAAMARTKGRMLKLSRHTVGLRLPEVVQHLADGIAVRASKALP